MILAVLAAAALLAPASSLDQPVAQVAAADGFISYTDDFAKFADETAAMPDEVRVRLFHARFDKLLPGFYQPQDGNMVRHDASLAKALRTFPEIRASYTATANQFATAFAKGQAHFRAVFPDYKLNMPVYLVHSLGQMDGGTRNIGGHDAMFFGADVISKIHDETTMGPFLDHELFHLYHASWFTDCDAVWCSLWQEGLAVYVASRLNPGANDRQLEMSLPMPLRPAVEPRLKEAMCLTRTKFESTLSADHAAFFMGQSNGGPFPPRFGYYVGYVLARKIGATMSLADMAHLPAAKVKPLLERTLADYGACPSD